jgi:peptide/nickel transport system permease protein
VSERRILYHYALRNALLPQISLLGMSVPFLFSGAVVVEVVFSLPGMGRVMAEAVMARDYPVILAAGVVAFGAVALGNFLADLVYLLADPRIRGGK